MPISHETLLLAKKYAEQLHAGGGTHYTGGHGIVVEGEKISIDTDVVAEQAEVQGLSQKLESTKQDLALTNQDLANTKQDLSTAKQNLSDFQTETNKNVNALNEKDVDLQEQINNLENGTTAIPVATSGKPGIVMPRQGLVIDRAGALNTTIEQYLDLACGTIFLAPKESKVIKLYHPCYVIYLEFYLVDSVNAAGSNLLYMSNVNNETATKGYLTATFDTDKGTYITLTNNHSTNGMFIHYGCKDLRQVD